VTEPRPFDPLALLRALEASRLTYIVVGTLAGVIRGTPETTDIVEICPSTRTADLARLERLLEGLGAVPIDGGGRAVLGTPEEGPRQFMTPHGELQIDPEPAGTAGYYDLRRHATRERLDDRGLRVPIAGVDDLLRVLRGSDLPEVTERVQMYRRLSELEREIDRGISL